MYLGFLFGFFPQRKMKVSYWVLKTTPTESQKTFSYVSQLFLTRWSFFLKNRNTVLLSINCQNISFFTAHVYFWGCSPAVGSGMHWSLNTISRLQQENKQVQSTIDKYLYKLLCKFQDKKKNIITSYSLTSCLISALFYSVIPSLKPVTWQRISSKNVYVRDSGGELTSPSRSLFKWWIIFSIKNYIF